MEITDSRRINAPRSAVWEALNDPDILAQAIPGCQGLTKTSASEMEGVVAVKIGPVSANFKGKVTLSNLNPPQSYQIDGEGSGGVAGFAKGGAKIRLEADGEDVTLLHYTVTAQIGGKLAQLGARLVEGTARRLAGEFFDKFSELIGTEPVESGESVESSRPAPVAPSLRVPVQKAWDYRLFTNRLPAPYPIAVGGVLVVVAAVLWFMLH
ncbi:MAG: carbon monoxide dehydrogenase subunit G [Candidatus Symbiobacter sp.]|nr:carbon monoxide dehydrogenase subunit G [Candidatus Symbiobacter sp.]